MEVKLQNLTKGFPNRDKKQKKAVTAVDRFSITIPDGKLVALLGPSGCGKSTTLNLISGLLKPTEGQIFFGERDVTRLPAEHRGIGLVFQNYALYPHLTVKQNIMFPLENLKGKDKLSKEELQRRVTEAAELVQIDGLMDRKPAELSGGQQQRVAIARAIVKMPSVLLLDEPLSNLDARLRIQTREEIRRIQLETGITTIFVTHDQEEAMSISDMIVVMKEGVMQQFGKPQEVYDDPHNLFVAKFLGTPPINVFDACIKDGRLYIGGEAVMEAKGLADRAVYAAVRPEGFVPQTDGAFSFRLKGIQVMGRDCSVLAEHDACHSNPLRAIVSSEEAAGIGKAARVREAADAVKAVNVREAVDAGKAGDVNEMVHFTLKPHKVYLFDRETEERIYVGE